MHTLALPTLPVNSVRAIAGGLCLACATLVPLSSHAFTYDVLAGPVIRPAPEHGYASGVAYNPDYRPPGAGRRRAPTPEWHDQLG
jgi:hypothetical protein